MWSRCRTSETDWGSDLLRYPRPCLFFGQASNYEKLCCEVSAGDISLLEEYRSWYLFWHEYSSLRSICPSNTREADYWLMWRRLCWHGRVEGAILMDVLMAMVVPEGEEEVLEEDEMALWFITTTTKSQIIQSISAPFERKSTRGIHVSTTISDDEQLRHQFE